jgi:EAL domain-containing protein (putative c-di-GMP-specific phosphodiesterase class I)
VLLDESDLMIKVLLRLNSMGVRISLDDFGTGFSSLGYLRRFAVDKIKIDKSFVQGLADRRDCLAIVRAIVSLAGSLDISTTGEGVETQEEADRLRAEGCIEGQGWLFGKPMPAAEVSVLLAAATAKDATVAA